MDTWIIFFLIVPTIFLNWGPVLRSRYFLVGSQSQCGGPAPAPGSTLDKTEEILNDIFFVFYNID